VTELARDMVESVAQRLADREEVVRAVRAVLRYFGGQLVYFPFARADAGSKQLSKLRDVLADEIGDADAELFVNAWTRYFGGSQMYMPLERTAFRDEIADEIYERFDGNMDTMSELCREYRTSYVQIYRLYHLGQKRKAAPKERGLFDEASSE
jgi:Mor family transcriptional regulator